MTSTFDPTLQHSQSIDRFERAFARAACGEKFDGWRLSSKRVIIPKTGSWPKSIKLSPACGERRWNRGRVGLCRAGAFRHGLPNRVWRVL